MKLRSLACALVLITGSAIAQAYPQKPVRMIVPFPPGGAADIVARQYAHALSDALRRQVIVDNRGGAGGAIGAAAVARAAPDGYTLLFASSSAVSINPHIEPKPPYDALRDFTPIVQIGYAPNVLVVHPSLPAKNVRELIAIAKARPGALNYASNGVGTLSHLTGELFMQRAGIELVHVPYRGAAPAVVDTISGNVSVLFAAYPSVSEHVQSGRLRALAVTSAGRMDIAKQLPTIAESALPSFESVQWWGLFGPAGLPHEIVKRLNDESNKLLRSPRLGKAFAANGVEVAGGTAEALARYHRADYEKWATVVKGARITGE